MIEKEFVAKLISKLTELTVQKRITWVSLPKYFDANDNDGRLLFLITSMPTLQSKPKVYI